MFKFNITLDDNDYFEACKYHYFKSPSGRRSVIFFRIFMLIFFAAVLYFSAIRNADFGSSVYVMATIILAIVFSIGAILLVVFTKPLLQISMRGNLNNLKKTGKLPYSKILTLLFEEECFTAITLDEESKTKYSAIERIVEADNAVHLYISSIQIHFIPLRVLLRHLTVAI